MAIEEQGSLFYCMTPQLRTISKDWEGLYLKGQSVQEIHTPHFAVHFNWLLHCKERCAVCPPRAKTQPLKIVHESHCRRLFYRMMAQQV